METADGPAKLISGGRYGLDVGITAACDKYLHHIPLDRQVRIARRQGAHLTTQSLWDQLWQLTTLLSPLFDRLRLHILQQDVIGVDQTGFSLIEKGGSKKWQAWQLSCPTGIYIDIRKTKEAAVGESLFLVEKDGKTTFRYAGIVMMDGAKELQSIARSVGFLAANCWSHARRNVLKAEGEAPGQVQEFLDLVGKIYEIERKAVLPSSSDDDPAERGYRHRIDVERLRRLRDTESRAVIGEIQKWMLAQRCIPGGKLKAGLSYVAQRWTGLKRFLEDPHIPLDNNLTERSYIGLAIGRRNYLGARSERGMQAAGLFYSLMESARLVEADPAKYLRAAAAAALSGDTPLLPHEWVQKD